MVASMSVRVGGGGLGEYMANYKKVQLKYCRASTSTRALKLGSIMPVILMGLLLFLKRKNYLFGTLYTILAS